jgi:hypothetical protein
MAPIDTLPNPSRGRASVLKEPAEVRSEPRGVILTMTVVPLEESA